MGVRGRFNVRISSEQAAEAPSRTSAKSQLEFLLVGTEAMTMPETGWNLLRWLYSLLFLATGVWIWTVVGGLMPPPLQPTEEAAEFMDALRATEFMNPLIGASYLVGGSALLFKRSTPLGLVVLAPSIAVIIAFHVVLTGQFVWPVLFMIWSAALFWRFRKGFACLWLFSDAEQCSSDI